MFLYFLLGGLNNLEPEHMNTPSGNPTDVLPRRPGSRFGDDLRNFAYLRDQAEKRNKIYLALVALCICSVVFTITTMSYKTYVVRVDNATGAVETGGELKATNYSPQEAELKHFLSQFIIQTRSIPLDPIAFRNNWQNAKHFMTKESYTKYTTFVNKEKPSTKLGHVTVQPEIKTMQIFPGTKNTYQVRWYEEEYSLNGENRRHRTNYVGLFQIDVKPQTDEKELLINPLGMRVVDFTYSIENTNGTTVDVEEVTTTVPTPAPAAAPAATEKAEAPQTGEGE